MTFVTLEDETGRINVVGGARPRRNAGAHCSAPPLLTVTGHVERVDAAAAPVEHLIAARLADHSALLGDLTVTCRDFH